MKKVICLRRANANSIAAVVEEVPSSLSTVPNTNIDLFRVGAQGWERYNDLASLTHPDDREFWSQIDVLAVDFRGQSEDWLALAFAFCGANCGGSTIYIVPLLGDDTSVAFEEDPQRSTDSGPGHPAGIRAAAGDMLEIVAEWEGPGDAHCCPSGTIHELIGWNAEAQQLDVVERLITPGRSGFIFEPAPALPTAVPVHWVSGPDDQSVFDVPIQGSITFQLAASGGEGPITLAHSDLPDGMSCNDVDPAGSVTMTCGFTSVTTGFSPVMFDAVSSDGTSAGARTFAVGAGRYVALGDSYSSGEGAAEFPSANYTDGTDDGSVNKCHRKINAYGPLFAQDIGYGPIGNDGNGPKFRFVACSGATIADMYAPSCQALPGLGCTPNNLQHNIPEDKREPAQMDALCPNRNVSDGSCVARDVTLVTLTIGGDDAGFVQVLSTCIQASDDAGCTNQQLGGQSISDFINSLGGRLSSLYTDIHARAPSARILVMGYPRIFPANPSHGCTYGLVYLPSRTQAGEYLTVPDLKWLNARGAQLDKIIEQAVSDSGVAEYVKADDAINGHEACADNAAWINDIQLLHVNLDNNCAPVQCESFHPNGDGYKALKDAVSGVYSQPAKHSAGMFPPETITETISPIDGSDGPEVSVTFSPPAPAP